VEIFDVISEVLKAGSSAALCTIVSTKGSVPRHEGSKMLVYPSGKIFGTVGGGEVEQRVIAAGLEAIADLRCRLVNYKFVDPETGDVGVCGGTMDVFIEPIMSKEKVLVVGGGHVGKAVVHLAHWLGFFVTVSDDREDLCNPEVHPEANEFIICDMKDLPDLTQINSNTYIILTTRGSSVDIEGLGPLLETKAGYIGVIGSRRRWATTRNGLLEKGINEQSLSRVNSPIGLELNAETPEEIAVSILAEIIMLRNRGSGKSMKGLE